MLHNCNALSSARLATAQKEFAKHQATLSTAKKDLDYIFKKIRVMKAKLAAQYPNALDGGWCMCRLFFCAT